MRFKSVSIIFNVCLILFLAGCATKYVAPTQKNLASIRVIDINGEAYKTAFISTYQEAENCTKRLWLQQGSYIPGEITTSFEKIEANKPLSISVYGSSLNPNNCVSTFLFTPEASRFYRAKKNGCNTVSLESSESEDFKVIRTEETQLMDFKKAFSESGSWCSLSPLNELNRDMRKTK